MGGGSLVGPRTGVNRCVCGAQSMFNGSLPVSRSKAARRIAQAVLAAVMALTGTPSLAQQTPAAGARSGEYLSLDSVKARWPQLDDVQRGMAIEQLISNGAFDEADQLLGAWKPTRADSVVHARLLLGGLRKAQGRHDEAIEILRNLLTSQPKHLRARMELAHALFLKKEDESARHHFELVLGAASNPDLETTVRRFIDAMDQRRSWHFSTYVSIAPSTNFNQGANVKTAKLDGLDFSLDEQNRKQSGIGLMTGVLGGYRLALTDRLDMVVGGGAHIREFKAESFDDIVASAEIGPRYRLSFGDVAAYATVARRWFGGDAYSMVYGGRLHTMLRLSPRDLVNAGGTCVNKEHDALVHLDGWHCGSTLAVDHAIDAAGFIRVLGGFERERTQRAHLDYDGWNAGFGVYREMPFGISVYGQLLYTHRNYEGVYPTSREAREDERIDATAHFTKRDWRIFGLAPMVQYTYTRNLSNIGFHTFDAHSVTTTLTKRF